MAKSDSSSTTINTTTATIAYSDFAIRLMYDIQGAKSLADATRALILRHENGDSDRELLGATFVLGSVLNQSNAAMPYEILAE